jgi:hypothetical protein
VEARAVSSGGGVRPFYRAGEGAGAAAGGGGINDDCFGIERKKGAVGREGDSVGEAGWSARLPWRRKEGGGEAGMAACGSARLGWRLGPA